MRKSTFSLTAAALLLHAGLLHSEVEFTWASVGDPGNPNDTTGYGGVAAAFRMSAFETTIAQYTEFLNAAAQSDPHGLFMSSMQFDPNTGGSIARSGVSGSYAYSVIGSGDRPVTDVNFFDALRFVNWLNNGQGGGGTETGAYTISSGNIVSSSRSGNVATLTTASAHTLSVGDQIVITGVAGGYNATTIVTAVTATTFSYANSGADAGPAAASGVMTGASATHNPDAQYWLPGADEWYKAAYYDPSASGPVGADDYWLYPTRSDLAPTAETPPGGGDSANFNNVLSFGSVLTDVGAYADSASHYGTYDQGGNVWEWTEDIDPFFGNSRTMSGGFWGSDASSLRANSGVSMNTSGPTTDGDFIGFRIASAVPEPSVAGLIAIAAVAGLLRSRKRKAA